MVGLNVGRLVFQGILHKLGSKPINLSLPETQDILQRHVTGRCVGLLRAHDEPLLVHLIQAAGRLRYRESRTTRAITRASSGMSVRWTASSASSVVNRRRRMRISTPVSVLANPAGSLSKCVANFS